MSTDLDKILTYQSIDLTKFEIRGARYGVTNARTTGPLYVDGTDSASYGRPSYVPASNEINGDGSFSSDSSFVTNITFDSPYDSLTTSSLKIGDSLTANSTSYEILSILSPSSYEVDATGLEGSHGISYDLGPRDYLIEPDSFTNTSTGTATFTQGDSTVIGLGVDPFIDLDANDFIKHDGFQQYFRIKGKVDNNTIGLVSAYVGDTTTGAYTAKQWYIGRTRVQYAKNNITYDNKSGKWDYESIIENDLTTATSFLPLVDGVHLKWTHSLSNTSPDIMDVATEAYITLAQETQYETSQFSLPVIPEVDTFEFYINDDKKDLYPDGERNYILSYSPNPVYEPPPPPDQRFICSVMFLDKVEDVTPSTEETTSGQMIIKDSEGNEVEGILPGSETILIDSTSQLAYRDYQIEPNAGVIEVTENTIDEQVVKYVGIDFSEYIDYGFEIYLNGVQQQISFPPQIDDDVLFQTATGALKPRDKEHPGPDEVYRIHYMVQTAAISDEAITVVDGQTVISTSVYPIKQRSVFLLKNGEILDERIDYFVSYLSGRISFDEALSEDDSIVVSYTPLSKQVNDLTYSEETWYCTVHDARLSVTDAENYSFALSNPLQNPEDIEVLRIYNETRDADYSLANLTQTSDSITLYQSSTNISIGIAETDIVLIDYIFESEATEYSPIEVNYLVLEEEDETIYIENSDLTGVVDSSSILNLQPPSTALQFFYTIDSLTYDGYGTRIDIIPPLSEDITNPGLFASDSTISFNTVPVEANPLVAGSLSITFSGDDEIRNLFRPKSIIGVNDERYQVSGNAYDGINNRTVVGLTSEILGDTTDSTSLSNIQVSDIPVYREGDTEVIPLMPVVTLLQQPGFIMNNDTDDIIDVTTDSTSLYIDGTSFLYTDYPTLSDMSGAVATADIYAMALTTYSGDWQSDKLLSPVDGILPVYRDSSSKIYVSPALRHQNEVDTTSFADTSNFSISEVGTILLDEPLVRYDRYKTDYMGREFLGEQQVEYSMSFFESLPKKSKINAAFEYANIDQFYVQVLAQRAFFETVSIPRMEEEAQQLNGNVGQGGELQGDTDTGASLGGLSGDEFRRVDTDIECRVFENIYDFFSDRNEAMADEFEAALGLKMFNNDGVFNKVEQEAAYKTFNRIFPSADYTNFEPMEVNPLTGYFTTRGAVFENGNTAVYDVSGDSFWDVQLAEGVSYIGLADSTRKYQVASISGPNTLILSEPFAETSTKNKYIKNNKGDYYTASSVFPIYDDDGNLGFKIEGTTDSDFGLEDGDKFECWVDGNFQDYEFENPPLIPLSLFLLFRVKNLTAVDVAKTLTSAIDGLVCTVDRIDDPEATFGFRNSLVLRPDTTSNKITLGNTAAIEKLGFTEWETSTGNWDRTDNNPEYLLCQYEGYEIGTRLDATNPVVPGNEIDDLSALQTDGTFNKLVRIDSTRLEIVDDVYVRVGTELGYLQQEVNRLDREIAATGKLIQESTIEPTYTNSLRAYNAAVDFRNDSTAGTVFARDYAYDIYENDFQDQTYNWKWILNFTDSSTFIRYKDISTNVGYDSTGLNRIPIAGQEDFILQAPAGDDRRILNADLSLQVSPADFYRPNIVYEDYTNINVPGDWSGWDYTLPVDGSYSVNNEILFTIDSTLLFTIEQDPSFTAPRYSNDTSAFTLNWQESDGNHKHEFLYSTHPTVGDLTDAIDAVEGFGIIPGSYSVDTYEYVDLNSSSNLLVPAPPGDDIFTGSNSPAFQFWSLDPQTLMFNMYSSDSTAPYYETDSTALVIIRIDGTNTTKSEFLYPVYSTLGALVSAVTFATDTTTTNEFTSGFQYTNLENSSGTLDLSAPGTPFYNTKLPTYKADSTAFTIDRAVGSVLTHYEYLYSTYSQLGPLETAIATTPNIAVTSLFDPTLAFGDFGYLFDSVAKSSPGTTVAISNLVNLFDVFFEMDTLRYQVDSTSLSIRWDENSVETERHLTYDDQSSVLDMKNAVDAITGLNVVGNAIYNTEPSQAFKISSGLIDTTADIYRGLGDSTVQYQTISDAVFNDRIPFLLDRTTALGGRQIYLASREPEIRSNITNEEILRDSDGNPSDLYIWANNRFNRRQGCYARLKQIERLMESNESALRVNRYLVG